ncbi:hypothetical protein NCC49_003986 [Naganishia albida]|nr:hypothetical protein NCC49_003986 [Naganishia albida]
MMILSKVLKDVGINLVGNGTEQRCIGIQTNSANGPKAIVVELDRPAHEKPFVLQIQGEGLKDRELYAYLLHHLIGIDPLLERDPEGNVQRRAPSISRLLSECECRFSDEAFSLGNLDSENVSNEATDAKSSAGDTYNLTRNSYALCVPYMPHLNKKTRKEGLQNGFPIYFAMARGDEQFLLGKGFTETDAVQLLKEEYARLPGHKRSETANFKSGRSTLRTVFSDMSKAASLAASKSFPPSEGIDPMLPEVLSLSQGSATDASTVRCGTLSPDTQVTRTEGNAKSRRRAKRAAEEREREREFASTAPSGTMEP